MSEETSLVDLANDRYVATLFNLIPIEIIESKPALFPARFVIPPAKVDEKDNSITPGVMTVTEGHHFIDNVLIEQGKPGATIRQITSPNVLANSLVNDYKYAHIGLADDSEPGLFWLPGKVGLGELKTDQTYKALYERTLTKHKNWYRRLIALADADWEKNHNMLAVSDLQRIAARALRVQKDWVEFTAMEMLNCPMCAMMVNSMAVVCSSCNFILKPEIFEANKSRFVGGAPGNNSGNNFLTAGAK
jgi:hypothetical protein